MGINENKYKTALSNFPLLLDSTRNVDSTYKTLFQILKGIVDFDYSIIYYLNSDRVNIKYKENCSFVYPDYITLSEVSRKKIFSSDYSVFDETSLLASELKLDKKPKTNFLIMNLVIRETVFGFILLAKNNGNFSADDIEILKSYGSVCSYAIKDNELFDVFKMQFKILQEDLVEKANAYKTIEEQNKKIIEADNIKNEFIANISHELRTPLNAIIGFTEILKEQFFGTLNPKQLEYVSDIHISSIHLLGMINEILDISRIESHVLKLNLSDIDFKILIQETINIIKPLSEKKKIEITSDIAIKNIYRGDYQKMQQILFNLLSNAIKFTPEKGMINITVKENRKNIVLSVKDNGIGIDKKYHGKIFGKFVQLDNNSVKKESSTGLGLTITKELVKLHGGSIRLESKLNEGTTFIIELPKSGKKDK